MHRMFSMTLAFCFVLLLNTEARSCIMLSMIFAFLCFVVKYIGKIMHNVFL